MINREEPVENKERTSAVKKSLGYDVLLNV